MSELLRISAWDQVPAAVSSGAILLELNGSPAGDATQAVPRLAALNVPSVAYLSGTGGPDLLAAALVCSIAVAEPDIRIDLSDVGGVLALGLTGALERRAADWLLFAPQPLALPDLCSAGLIRTELDPLTVAQRLADAPTTGLLVRSLRSAARSTAAQARAYDAELIALLTDGS